MLNEAGLRGPKGGISAAPSPASRRGVLVGAVAAGSAGLLPSAAAVAQTRDSGGRLMAGTRAADEARIRQLIDRSVAAIRAQDLDTLRSCFAPDVVSFDVGPDLASLGVAAKMRNWVLAFTVFQAPIGYEYRDLAITIGGDVAFAHSFNRLSGRLRNGGAQRLGPWVRYTGAYRRIDGAWLIAHDHVSVPVNVVTGEALLHLEPPA